jgi:hypothetical protein
LRELLMAVAVYATGGQRALERIEGPGQHGGRLLLGQMKPT